MPSPEKQRDGRTVRGERTREALVESLLALLDGGELRPTAAQIAEGAGVSERSVFQHFPDREALFEAVAREQYERVMPTLTPVDASLALGERIDALVAQRCRMFEQVKGVRRAALLMEPESDVVAGWLASTRSAGVAELERVFRRELEARPGGRARDAAGGARGRLRLGRVREPAPAPGAERGAHPRRHAHDAGARYSASADSSSAIACSACSKRTARMPSARAVSQLTSRSSRNRQSAASSPSPRRSSVSS